MAKQLNIDLSFNADASKAKAQIMDLQRSLDQLISSTINNNKLLGIDKEIKQAIDDATKLKVALQAATDADTGKLNLAKFSESLKNGLITLLQYALHLKALGPEGELSFLKLSKAIVSAETPMRQTNTMLNQMFVTLKNTAKWQISSSIIHGLQGGLLQAFNYAKDLDTSLNNIRIVTGYSTEEMAKFAGEANKAALALSTTTTSYTDAALIYYQQGIRDQDEIAARTETTIKLANVSRQTAEDVSSLMTAIWNNFDDGTHNLEYYADVITALGATTASSSQEIAKGMQLFAAVADTVGLSYEYAAASLATIVSVTRQSESTVGNGLRTIFSRLEGLKLGDTLEDGTDLTKYSEALAVIGVNIKDASGLLKDMDSILEETASKWDQLDKAQKVAFATTVGGVRQYTNLIALLDNWDTVQENINTAKGAEGTLQEQADIYAQSWEAAEKRVRAAAQKIYKDLIDEKFFIKLGDFFTTALNGVDNFINAIGGIPGVIAGVGVVLTTVFGKQLSESINSAMYEFSRFTGKAEDIANVQRQDAIKSINDYYNTGDGSFSLTSTFLKLEVYDSYELLKITANLTDLQKAYAQEVLRTAELYHKVAIESEKVNNNTFKQLANAKGSLANDLGNKALPNGTINEVKTEGSKEVKLLESEIKLLISELAEAEKNSLADTSAYERYVENLEKVKLAKEEILLETLKLEEAENKENASTEKLEQAKLKLADADAAAKAAKAEMHGSYLLEQLDIEVIADFILKKSEYLDLNRNKLIALIQATADHTKSLEENIRAISAAVENDEELRKKLEELKTGFLDIGTGAVNTLRGVSLFAMGITSLKGAIDALNDTDLTFFEKFSRVSMGFSIGLSLLAAGLPTIKNGIIGIGTGINTLTGAITLAEGATLTLGLALGLIAPYAAAIIALGAAIYAIWAFSPEGQLARANKEVEKTKKAYDEATNAVNDFKSTYDDWSSLYSKTKELTEGTLEYIEAMEKANQKAMELIDKYNLIQGVDWDFDDKGNISINYDNYAKLLRLEQDQKYVDTLKSKNNANNIDIENKINKTADSQSNGKWDTMGESFDRILSKDTLKDLATLYALNEITPAELSKLVSEEVQKFENKHSTYEDEYTVNPDTGEVEREISYEYKVSDEELSKIISSIMALSQDIKNINSINANNDRQAELAEARIKLNEKGSYEFGMDLYLNKYYEKKEGYDSVEKEKFEYDNADIIANLYNRINDLMSSFSDTEIDEKTRQQVLHAILDSILSGNQMDFSGIDTSKWDKALIDKFGDLSDEVLGAIDRAAANITPEKVTQSFKDIESITKELDKGNSISTESYSKLTKAQQAYFKDMGDGTYLLIGEAKDFINALRGEALTNSISALEKLLQQENTVNRLSLNAIEGKGESYLWNKDVYLNDSGMAKLRVEALSAVGQDTTEWDTKLAEGNMTADDYAKLTEEVYKYKDAIIALATSGQDFGASLLTVLNSLAAQATSLYELQGYMQSANGNYEAYSVGLMDLASLYDNCEQELKEYQEALESQDKAAIDAALSALEQSIIIGEASKKYSLNAKTVETLARLLEKAYGMSADLAARLAVANERMNRGVATLNKNWTNWGKTLKSTDHTSQKYAEALNEATEALADLTGTADAASIPVDFLDSSTASGSEHLKLMEEAANGSEKAINLLGVALGEATVLGMSFNENFALAAIDSGALEMSLELAKNSFSTWQGEVLEGITALQDAIVNGTVAAGDNITSLMDGTGQDWVNSLNAMALATGMSVEEMNSLLNQLGVQAKVDVVSVPQEMQVPTYTEYSEATLSHPAEYEELEGGGRVLKTPPSWSRKTWTVPGEPKTVTGYAQVAQISTEDGEIGAPQITYTGTAGSGKGGGVSKPTGSGGGGGGGGSAPKPAKKKDVTKKQEKEVDRYIKINLQLDKAEHENTLLDAKLQSTSGQSAIKVMKDQLSILKQLKKLYQDLEKEAKAYREKDLAKMKEDFANLDFQIDPSDGMLLNYEALLKEQTDLYNKVYNEWTDKIIQAEKDYNDLIAILGEAATEEALKPWAEALEKIQEDSKEPIRLAEEQLEKFKKDTDKYNDSVEQARKAHEEAVAKANEAYSKELEIIAKGVEIKIKVDDADLQYLEFLLKQIGDTVDGTLDRMSNYAESIESNMSKIEKYQDGLEDVLDHAGIDFDDLLDGDLDDLGTFNEEDLAKVEEYRDGLISCGEQLIDLREKILNEVHEAFDKFNSDLDDAVGRIEHLKKFTETYKNIIDIIGKKVIDPTGQTTLMLTKTLYTQSQANTRALQDLLDFQLSAVKRYEEAIAELEADNRHGEHDDTIKEFKEQLKEAQQVYESTQENWLSSWESTVLAAADIYEAELNLILEDFNKSVAGLMGSLDKLSERYSRIQATQSIYVEDYEKIYQLSKLTRDINNSLDDSTTLASKGKLRDIQKEINELQESGVEVSQYDLDVLRKKYEMAIAYEQWQDAQNAKTVVRMQRDNEGNYGYVYTADLSDVEAAQLNYEDKLHEMQVLNGDYINNLQEQIIQAEQECADALANLRASDYASYEEYQAAVEQIRSDYTDRVQKLSSQLEKALGNNQKLYETDWTEYSKATGYKISADEKYIDRFEETVLSQLTGFKTVQDAQDAFVIATNDASDLAAERWEDWYIRSNDALELGGMSMQNYTQEVDEAINGSGGIVDLTKDAEEAVDDMADEYSEKFDDIVDYAEDFAKNFDDVIQEIIDSCNEAIEAIRNLLEMMAEMDDSDSDNDEDTYAEWFSLKDANGNLIGWKAKDRNGNWITGSNKTLDWEGNDQISGYRATYNFDSQGNLITQGRNAVGTGFAGTDFNETTKNLYRKTDTTADSSVKLIEKIADSVTNIAANQKYPGPQTGMATGGYTGEWGDSSGRLAVLHEKELVLNSDDTANILSAVDMIRSISNAIDLNALAAGAVFAGRGAAVVSSFGNDTLEQNVHITAEFPSVSDHNEIEEALNSLVERAAQFAGRKKF